MSTYGRRQPGRKIKRRKARFIKGYLPWCGIHKETQQRANRVSRRNGAVSVEARVTTKLVNPSQGKQPVAGNRCGNECGRRAVIDDYLCKKCR